MLRLCVAFEVDSDAHTLSVGFVTELGDAGDLLVLDEFGDLLDEFSFVDLVRKFSDDDLSSAAGSLVEMGLGADNDLAAAGGIG